jgi:hypothetical protein
VASVRKKVGIKIAAKMDKTGEVKYQNIFVLKSDKAVFFFILEWDLVNFLIKS